ncbi:hypothetical protein PENTCL1PPCAC_23657, partial [Pristionchus entomophagus]
RGGSPELWKLLNVSRIMLESSNYYLLAIDNLGSVLFPILAITVAPGSIRWLLKDTRMNSGRDALTVNSTFLLDVFFRAIRPTNAVDETSKQAMDSSSRGNLEINRPLNHSFGGACIVFSATARRLE